MFTLVSTLPDGATAIRDNFTGRQYVLKPGVWDRIKDIESYKEQYTQVRQALDASTITDEPQDTLDPNTTGASTGSEQGSR